MIDVKKQNEQAHKWLLENEDMRKQYIAKKTAFSEIAATAYTGMPHGSGVSNPCEDKAITLVELDRLKLQLMVIESVEWMLDEDKSAFLMFRRRAEVIKEKGVGRPPWADYVQARFSEWYVQRYGREKVPHRNTLSEWMNEIVDITVRIAIKMGAM